MPEPNEDFVTVEMEVTFQVQLPEGVKYDGEEVGRESRERAIEAVIGSLPQEIQVYIDGEDKDPTRVYIDASEDDVREVYGEE